MPNKPTYTNTDPPLVRNPIPDEQTAGLSDDDRLAAEGQALGAMRESLGRQADGLDGEHGRKLESNGYVSRQELEALLAEHQRQMAAVLSVFEMFQKNDPRRGGASTDKELEDDRLAHERTVMALKTAPRVPVYIQPEPYEAEALKQHDGQPLLHIIQINSVNVAVPVGQVSMQPAQIADVLRHSQEGRKGTWRQGPVSGAILRFDGQEAQDLETIPRPQRRPWAEEMGRSGIVSTDEFRPFQGGQPTPLDAR
jgi:hypothetical protein